MIDKNSITEDEDQIKKQYHTLFSNEYFNGCTKYRIDGKTFRESTDYRLVEGWKGTNELDILKEHERKKNFIGYKKLLDYIDFFAGFGKKKMEAYTYEMYDRHYLEWECDGKRTDWIEEMNTMHSVINGMTAVSRSLVFNLFVVGFEFGMLHMHMENALSQQNFNWAFLGSRVIGLLISLIAGYYLVFDFSIGELPV